MSGIILVECPVCGMGQIIHTDHPVCCSCGHDFTEEIAECDDDQDEEDEE